MEREVEKILPPTIKRINRKWYVCHGTSSTVYSSGKDPERRLYETCTPYSLTDMRALKKQFAKLTF